jgi:hypothetical protein
MNTREYETPYVTHINYTGPSPISDYEEQLRNNGYAVVYIPEAY